MIRLTMNNFLKLFLCAFLLSSLGCQASNKDASFESFWTEFRNAALKEDYATLNKLVKFPLEVKGVDDDTPSKLYSQKQLQEIFPLLLDQVVYNYDQDDVQENSLKELIRKKESVSTTASQTEYRIEQFEFKKANNEWLLVRAYLE